MGCLNFTKNAEPAFQKDGFVNWKKGKEKLSKHESSNAHKEACDKILSRTAPSVQNLISTKKMAEQNEAREMLMKLFSSLRFLANHGCAIRGHGDNHSIYRSLLRLRGDDDPRLFNWLSRSKSFIHNDIQNEMLCLMANDLLRNLLQRIRCSRFGYFSLIVDGTTDISGMEQMSICIRYVQDNLIPEELFFGLYDAPAADSETIVKIIKDVLQRFNLPINLLRGQCYDGASNMKGAHSGTQARILQEEPRALYIHCGNHSLNLAVQETCSTIKLLRDCFSETHRCATFFRESRVRSQILKDTSICLDEDEEQHTPTSSTCAKLRAICPTRFTVRHKAIKSLLDNYEAVLRALDKISESSTDAGSVAGAHYKELKKGSFYLSLLICDEIVGLCDHLSVILQSSNISVSGSLQAVEFVVKQLQTKRTDEQFQKLWTKADEACERMQLSRPKDPRTHRVPKRLEFSDQASEAHKFDAHQQFKVTFFQALDVAVNEIQRRFNQPAYRKLEILEKTLLTAARNQLLEEALEEKAFKDTVAIYDEFDQQKLKMQLQMLGNINQLNTCENLTEVRAHVFIYLFFQQTEHCLKSVQVM